MKKTKKFLAFLLAMIMVLAMGMTTMAADINKVVGITGSAAIKVTLPNPQGETADNTYKIYKVFDATTDANGQGISYKVVDGKENTPLPAGFSKDGAGNISYNGTSTNGELTTADINAIKDYVTEDMLVATVKTTKGDKSFDVTALPYGYYYITTTTGTLVTVDSTTPYAEVSDKNKVPTLDKDIANVNGVNGTGADNETGATATAQIGDTINYTVTITAQKGAENYVFHDELSAGLTLKEDSEPVVKVDNTVLTKDSDYVLSTFKNVESDEEDDIVITFTETYLNTITTETYITITYSAILNKNAVVESQETELTGNKNSATLEYGHNTNTESGKNITPPDEPKVYTYKFSLVKDNNEKVVLTGAKFKIYDSETGGNEIPVVKKSEGVYRVANLHNNETGIEIEAGSPSIEGLAADRVYWLEEIEAPAGYNKLAGRVKIILTTAKDLNGAVSGKGAGVTITYQGNEKTAGSEAGVYNGKYSFGGVEVVNQKGAELPSTGGIGTTMFYVIGGALVVCAAVLLVTRKRMSVEK